MPTKLAVIAAALVALALSSGWAAPHTPATALPRLVPDAFVQDAGAPPDAFPLPADAAVPRDTPIYGAAR